MHIARLRCGRQHTSLVVVLIIISGTSRGVEGVEPFHETGLPLLVGQLLEVEPVSKRQVKMLNYIKQENSEA
jgi:hypothetical protein